MKTTHDTYRDGRWLQRLNLNGKYTWTISGVLWNNIKERTTPGSTTQLREPSYVGSKNGFESFASFADWNMSQVGYGLGYDVDSDILLSGCKTYSAETCLLIPSGLNRFLQSRKKERTQDLPMGLIMSKSGRLFVRNIIKDDVTGNEINLLNRYVDTIEEGISAYEQSVEKSKHIWIDRLQNSGRYCVDERVIEYMNTWKYKSDWEPK